MSDLRPKTGGCTTLGMYPSGLFEHQGELYVARQKWAGGYMGGLVKVIRCSDGERIILDARASVYPVEYQP